MNGQKAKYSFEAKLRQNLSSADTVITAVNLIDGYCDIRVLVLSNCCQFWGKIAHNQRKRKKLVICLSCRSGIITRIVCAAVLINSDGCIEEVSINASPMRVFIVKVPGSALDQH
jgi:hypothetical protein